MRKWWLALGCILGACILYAGQTEIDESLKAISNNAVKLRYYINTDGSTNLLRVSGTLPAIPTTGVFGVRIGINSAGSAAFPQNGMFVQLNAGYTGSNTTITSSFSNSVAGTGTTELGAFLANYGLNVATTGITSGINVGGLFRAYNSSTRSYGSISLVNEINTSTGDGIASLNYTSTTGLTNAIGVAAYIGTSVLPAYTSAALLADNLNSGKPIILARENGTSVFTVDTLGNIKLFRTITAAGTTGAQTINKPSGTVNFAAATTTLVVTNSIVDASSIIHAMARTNDATCHVKDIEMAVGSFTIRMTAACTAETSVGFLVTN